MPPSDLFQRTFSSLSQRNFRLFWFGQSISLVGSGMQSVGQAWLVLQLTHSAWQLGLVGALQALPILLFTLFGGVFADRWPKRRVLLVTQTAAMLQALALWALIVSGAIQLWHLYLLALLLGLTNSLDRPARQAFVVEMVGREHLLNAVALNASLGNLARIIGPGLGGVIIAASSVTLLFLLNGLSFLAVLAGLALIDPRALHAQPHLAGEVARSAVWRSAMEGLRYVWGSALLKLVILVAGLVLLFGSNFNVVLPLFASDLLRSGAQGFGALSAAVGAGSLLAALWLAWRTPQPSPARILLGTLLFALLEVAFAISRFFPLSLLLIAAVGFTETAFAELAVTLVQSSAPDALRGRVMSVYILFFDGSLPLGYMLMGWLSAQFGPALALLTGAGLCLLVTGVGLVFSRVNARQAPGIHTLSED
jgi:MFS family permease